MLATDSRVSIAVELATARTTRSVVERCTGRALTDLVRFIAWAIATVHD